MEEKSKIQFTVSLSDWKLKQEVLKNQRNYRQLANRLVILEMEKGSKIKSIEKKLQAHKKIMEIRMERFKHLQDIQKHSNDVCQMTGTNSRVFKETRMSRAANIRSRSGQLREINNKLVKDVRKEREENQKYIKIESERQLLLKVQKRNKVRLIEIQCKENVNKFWSGRLEQLREMREIEIARKMDEEDKKIEWLKSLEKSQEELLREIKKTQEMESQLMTMMIEEKSMLLNATNIPKS